jgi:hypothetical protein
VSVAGTLRIVGGRLQARLVVQGVEAAATVRPQTMNGRIGLAVDDLPARVPTVIRDAVNSLLAKGSRFRKYRSVQSLKQVAVDGQSVLLTATAVNVQLPVA